MVSGGSVFSMGSQQQEKLLREGGFQWPPIAKPPHQGGSEVAEREPGKRGTNVLSRQPWKMELGVNPSTTSKNMLEWTPWKASPLRQRGVFFRGQHRTLPRSLVPSDGDIAVPSTEASLLESRVPVELSHRGHRAAVLGTGWPVTWRRGRRVEETLSSNNPPSLSAPHLLNRTGMPASG